MNIPLILVITILTVHANPGRQEWLNFKTQYGKTYKNIQEEALHYNTFFENLKKIRDHNEKYHEGMSSFQMGINQFADMTDKEFRETLSYHQPNFKYISKERSFISKSMSDIPETVDWRQEGAVTPVKNQGAFGASCVFGILGSLEGIYFLKSGNLVPLSAQNIEDCTDISQLCTESEIYNYLIENGIMSEADYPSPGDGLCHFNESKIVTKISSHDMTEPGDEDALKTAIATIGPIAAEISVSENFQFYVSGILDDSSCRSDQLNHAVLIVGYGSLNGSDYWIVKNSWGTSWGDRGYLLMSRNKNNQCGISTQTSYPII